MTSIATPAATPGDHQASTSNSGGAGMGGGGGLPQLSWEGDRMFNIYIWDYCSKRGFTKTAQELRQEATLDQEPRPPINARQGLLFEWWSVFWVLFAAKSNQNGSDEAMIYTHHNTLQRQASARQGAQPLAMIPASSSQQPSVPAMMQQMQQRQAMPPGSAVIINGGMANNTRQAQAQAQASANGAFAMANGVQPPFPPTPQQQNNNNPNPNQPQGQQQQPQMNGVIPPPQQSGTQLFQPTQQQQQQQQQQRLQQQQQQQQQRVNGLLPFQSPTMTPPNLQQQHQQHLQQQHIQHQMQMQAQQQQQQQQMMQNGQSPQQVNGTNATPGGSVGPSPHMLTRMMPQQQNPNNPSNIQQQQNGNGNGNNANGGMMPGMIIPPPSNSTGANGLGMGVGGVYRPGTPSSRNPGMGMNGMANMSNNNNMAAMGGMVGIQQQNNQQQMQQQHGMQNHPGAHPQQQHQNQQLSSPSLTPRVPNMPNIGPAPTGGTGIGLGLTSGAMGVDADLMSIPGSLLMSLKMEMGFQPDKDVGSLSGAEKQRILSAYRQRLQQPARKAPPGQGPPGQMGQPGQIGQVGVQGRGRNKRSSTSPGEEHDSLPRNDNSPPDRKRPRRSPMSMDPNQQQQPPPPNNNGNNIPASQTSMPYPQMMQQRGGFGGMGGSPMQGHLQPQPHPMAAQMGASMQQQQQSSGSMMTPMQQQQHTREHQYRHGMGKTPGPGPGGQQSNAGSPIPQQDFNQQQQQFQQGAPPFLGRPAPNPNSKLGAGNIVPGMLPPPAPHSPGVALGKDMGMKQDKVDDVRMQSQSHTPVPGTGGSAATPTATSASNPTSSAPNNNNNAPSSTPSNVMTLSPTSIPMPLDEDMFTADFINNVANGLEDFSSNIFNINRPDGDINFERDFGQWFNPDDSSLGGEVK